MVIIYPQMASSINCRIWVYPVFKYLPDACRQDSLNQNQRLYAGTAQDDHKSKDKWEFVALPAVSWEKTSAKICTRMMKDACFLRSEAPTTQGPRLRQTENWWQFWVYNIYSLCNRRFSRRSRSIELVLQKPLENSCMITIISSGMSTFW